MIYSGSNLLGYAVFAFILLRPNASAESGVACKDQQGRSHQSGSHYIPGLEPCTFCVCDNGNPKWCKAFICKFPEEDCKSFRRGDTCCDFICMDDTLSSISNGKTDGIGGATVDGSTNYDIGLRSVASFVTAVLSLSLLFFLIHRLRQRKIRGRQSRQLVEDQRNMGSMGYLERDGLSHGVPMDDISCGASYPLWKPPSNYFPRGEAPPPYEEAVAAARAEQALLSMNPHTLPQLNFPNSYLANANSRTSVSLLGTAQAAISGNPSSPLRESAAGVSPAAVISSSSRPVSNPNIYASYRQANQTEQTSPGVSVGTSTTSFTSTYENLPAPLGIPSFTTQHQGIPAQPAPASQSAIPKGYQPHTTLPRQAGAFTISANLANPTGVNAHRTIPRTLTGRTGARLREIMNDCSANEFLRLSPTGVSNLQNFPRPIPHSGLAKQENTPIANTCYEDAQVVQPSSSSSSTVLQQAAAVERQQMDLKMVGKPHDFKPPLTLANEINEEGSFESVACTCSMHALPPLHDDTDDYRSECENCKSATGSRYYLDNEDELVTSPHETMTLHRRPDETASSTTPQYYRTSLTLPISTRQRSRSTGVRENWFNTMPQSSTESSDEN